MPIGFYKRTEIHKQITSEGMKGFYQNDGIHSMKGKKQNKLKFADVEAVKKHILRTVDRIKKENDSNGTGWWNSLYENVSKDDIFKLRLKK